MGDTIYYHCKACGCKDTQGTNIHSIQKIMI